MATHRYIIDTEPAVQGLFDLINREENRIVEVLEAHLQMDQAARNVLASFQRQGGDSALLIQLDGFERAKERTQKEFDDLGTLIANLRTTYNSLAGAVFQIAKQGISTVHGTLSACPNGRIIGTSEPLKNVVWQTRNQSMHFEELNYHENVKDCFANLVADFGDKLKLGTENHALTVLKLLGWNTYENYKSDISTLLPC